jgi:alpha/beta superfamily hydrolase
MLFINPSYIDVEGFTEKLNTFPNTEKILVYGKADRESCALVEYLNKVFIGPLQVIAVEGATHEFKGKIDEFIASIDLL